MKIFFRKFTLGENYVVSYSYKNKKLCKFVQVTEKGFNFLVLNTDKYFFKNHIYPKNNWFILFNKNLRIHLIN